MTARPLSLEHPMKRMMYAWRCTVCNFYTFNEDEAITHETGLP